MILALRQRHRRMMISFGVILPAAFVAGVGLRQASPVGATPLLLSDPQSAEIQTWERNDLFPKAPVSVRLLHTPAFSTIQLLPGKAFVKPDLLVYWVAGSAAISEILPPNAKLLGSFNSAIRLQLPEDTGRNDGVLILYSLADQQIVDVSRLCSLTTQTK